jgi:hypothetical protein
VSLAPIWCTVDHAYYEFLEFALAVSGPNPQVNTNHFLTNVRRKIMANSNQGNNGNQGNQGGGKGGNQQSEQDTSARGFASMDPEKQREIAAEGGRAAHAAGTAHEFTSEEARRAGSMSHGNRQADQASSRSGGTAAKQGGGKGNQQEGGGNKSSSGGGNKSR